MKSYCLNFFVCTLMIGIICLGLSCQKDNEAVIPEPTIYTLGHQYNGNGFVAKMWKNEVPTNLTDGASEVRIRSIYVSDTYDVYAVGGSHAAIWKNGIPTNLDGIPTDLSSVYGSDFFTSVYVNNSDVYVAGRELLDWDEQTSFAKVWKNGTPTNLTDGSSIAGAKSIFVHNGDVYVAGYEHNGTFLVAKVWKNGTPTNLTAGASNAQANSVFVYNGDVYVAGYEYNGQAEVAKVWKNGTDTNLTLNNDSILSVARSIYVSDNGDVYVAGYEYDIVNPGGGATEFAQVWRNGTPTNPTLRIYTSSAYSVFVHDDDVYVAGHEYNGYTEVAKVWKNGIDISLTDGSYPARAFSVFVK